MTLGYLVVVCGDCGRKQLTPVNIGDKPDRDHQRTLAMLEDDGWKIDEDGVRCKCPACNGCEDETE